MNKYEIYGINQITKKLLDEIQVGDLVKINSWGSPMRVLAVSDTHAIMVRRHPKYEFSYSILEKVPASYSRNNWYEGQFRCGPDNYYCFYDYNTLDGCHKALLRLKDGLLPMLCWPVDTPREVMDRDMAERDSIICDDTRNFGYMELGRHSVGINRIAFKHTEYNKDNIQAWIDKVFNKNS